MVHGLLDQATVYLASGPSDGSSIVAKGDWVSYMVFVYTIGMRIRYGEVPKGCCGRAVEKKLRKVGDGKKWWKSFKSLRVQETWAYDRTCGFQFESRLFVSVRA